MPPLVSHDRVLQTSSTSKRPCSKAAASEGDVGGCTRTGCDSARPPGRAPTAAPRRPRSPQGRGRLGAVMNPLYVVSSAHRERREVEGLPVRHQGRSRTVRRGTIDDPASSTGSPREPSSRRRQDRQGGRDWATWRCRWAASSCRRVREDGSDHEREQVSIKSATIARRRASSTGCRWASWARPGRSSRSSRSLCR